MRIISHRGLIDGPDENLENRPDQIELALSKGYDVEVDLRYSDIDNSYYLGHDYPEFKLETSYLKNLSSKYPDQEMWIHCKDVYTLHVINGFMGHEVATPYHYFYHNTDAVGLTNHNYEWLFPTYCGVLTERSVRVLPERSMTPSEFRKNFHEPTIRESLKKYHGVLDKKPNLPGFVCTDYARLMRKALKD